MSEDIKCPFCGEDDYDKPGLWSHLRDCEAYDAAGDAFRAEMKARFERKDQI